MRTFTSAALLAAALFGFNAFAGSGELDYPPAGAGAAWPCAATG